MSESHFEKIAKVRKIISDLLQLDRLERLAKTNSIIAIAYAQIIMHINYVLLTWDRDVTLNSGILGKELSIDLGGILRIKIEPGGNIYPPTIAGKLAAIGFCFAHDAGKLDNVLSTKAFTEAMVGVSAIGDMAIGVAKAAMGATKLGLNMQQLPALPKLPEKD